MRLEQNSHSNNSPDLFYVTSEVTTWVITIVASGVLDNSGWHPTPFQLCGFDCYLTTLCLRYINRLLWWLSKLTGGVFSIECVFNKGLLFILFRLHLFGCGWKHSSSKFIQILILGTCECYLLCSKRDFADWDSVTNFEMGRWIIWALCDHKSPHKAKWGTGCSAREET